MQTSATAAAGFPHALKLLVWPLLVLSLAAGGSTRGAHPGQLLPPPDSTESIPRTVCADQKAACFGGTSTCCSPALGLGGGFLLQRFQLLQQRLCQVLALDADGPMAQSTHKVVRQQATSSIPLSAVTTATPWGISPPLSTRRLRCCSS